MKTEYYEQAILSYVMNSETSAEVFAKISAEDFGPHYRAMYEIAVDLYNRGVSPDVVSMAEEAERMNLYDGGKMDAFVEVLNSAFSPENVSQYCSELKRLSMGRKLQQVATQIQLWSKQEDPDTAYEKSCEALTELNRSLEGDSITPIPKALKASLEDLERRFEMGEDQFDGLPTGFQDIDERWMGMKPGNFIVIDGRPGQGKTTFAMNICEHNARQGKSILFFSLEMDAKELADKTLSSVGGIDFGRIMSGKMQDDDWPKLTTSVSLMKDADFYIDDRASLSVPQMRAQAYRIQREYGLDLICIDYLQLMTAHGQNRENEVSAISRGLKGLAKEMGVPVIGVAQLSRKCEERKNKRPVNSDLRESGSIEQDANLIAHVYRDDYYYEDSPVQGIAEIITGKGRSIKPGTDCLAWRGELQRFDNLTYRPDVESVADQQESGGKRKRDAF